MNYFLEVYYGELRDKGTDVAQIVLDMVQHYSIKIVNTVSAQVFKEAASLKVAYKMSLADCIGLATAIEFSGQFVTSDHNELEEVVKSKASLIYWFRQEIFMGRMTEEALAASDYFINNIVDELVTKEIAAASG